MVVTRAIIGVDVGGTNTDAVIVEKSSGQCDIIGKCKTSTTDDVTSGVRAAIHLALIASHKKCPNLAIQQINIGTTHFINAVVEGKGLTKVSVIRLCGTASRSLPPFSDFPESLVKKVRASVYLVDGGYQIDGSEISPVNRQELQNCIGILKANGERNIVVSGVFSTIRAEQELFVAKFIKERFPEASITASHTIGKIGMLERENAAIMNECIKPLCRETIAGFRSAVQRLGLNCPFYLTQNDGTLLSEEMASQYPVLSFASGATNSMRGAAFLSGIKDAIVVDIGGTSSDVGLLTNGFPREASARVSVGGVKTNFRMPDVVSIGLGGGSYVVKSEKDGHHDVTVGPQSAGYRIIEEAYVFAQPGETAGRTCTATDIAVAAGVAEYVGLKSNVKDFDKQFVRAAMDQIHFKLGACVDQMRFANKSIPLILVGGGSILVDTKYDFEGVTEIIQPTHNDVANAVGAALSQISSKIDQVVDLEEYLKKDVMQHEIDAALRPLGSEATAERTKVTEAVKKTFLEKARENALNAMKQIAEKDALKAGAKKGTLTVVDKEDIPLAYIPGHRTRVVLKVAGELDDALFKATSNVPKAVYKSKPEIKSATQKKQTVTTTGNALVETSDIKIQAPKIDKATGEWSMSEYDIECLHIGAGIMGCGGGGNPHIARTLAMRLLKSGKQIRVVNPARFLHNADPVNDVVTIVAFMGAPLAIYEKLVAGNETVGALECMKDLFQIGGYENGELRNTNGVEVKPGDGVKYIEDYNVSGKVGEISSPGAAKKPKIIALMSAEIGGMNCIEPLIVAASLNLPVLDCDGMGRAFPELQMFAPFIYGSKPYPATLADDKGRRAVVLHADNPKCLENHFRQEVMKMGCMGGTVLSVFRKDDVLKKTVQYSLSHAWRLGDTILKARSENRSPVDAMLESENGTLLVYGKVIDISRESTSGFTVGKIVISGLDKFDGSKVLIEFQNEFLLARDVSKESKILACVPDLITVVDPDTAQPVPTEEIRFGIRVSVVAIRSHPLMSSETALKFVGPQAFGFGDDVKYVPIGTFKDTKPVCPE